MSTTMTIRLEDEVKDRLDNLAGATRRGVRLIARSSGGFTARCGSTGRGEWVENLSL